MESQASSSSLHTIRFIDSYRKGNKLLVCDGFIFSVNNTVKSVTYFKCNRKSKGCRARVLLYDFDKDKCTYKNYKVQAIPHNHLPCPEKILQHEVITVAKGIVEENVNLKTSIVVEEVTSKLISSPQDSPVMGKISQLKRNIRNARRRITGERRIGSSREDFILPKELQLTKGSESSDGKQFLLKDIPGNNRTLVFATKPMLEVRKKSQAWLCVVHIFFYYQQKCFIIIFLIPMQILSGDCTVWLLDGTFKLAPDWFNQVFTIHAMYMNVCIPFVYSLLPGKKGTDYLAVLDAVTSAGSSSGGFNPDYIISDFEMGIIKACKQIFPHTNLHGCLFHLSQSIYRKVQSLGLAGMYLNSDNFRFAVRSLSALAFVPPGDVFMRFMELKSFFGHCHDSRKVIDYFFANYIGDTWDVTTFPIPFWNCYDRFIKHIPRTNNAVEGWHFKINSTLSGSHPSVWTFVEKIQKEQKFWEEEIPRVRTGLGERRRKKYRQLDDRLNIIVSNYNTALGTIDYLKAIATCMYDYMY